MIASMISQPAVRPAMLSRLAFSGVALFAIAVVAACADPGSPAGSPADSPPRYVAHAGGSADGHVVTNSLEALEDSVARGHTFIEVDISWTSDDMLVLLHDWTLTTERLFGAPPGEMNWKEFMAAPSRIGQTQIDGDDLFVWLGAHPDVVIVTDVKGRSLEALGRIARSYPGLLSRIVPQLYSIEEHEPVVALGYPRVILTLYATPMEDADVLAYAAEHAPLAVTMPLERGAGPLPRALEELGVFSYAHTTSDYLEAARLFRNGIDGVYTDYLAPEDDVLAFDESVALPWTALTEHPQPLSDSALTFLPVPGDGLTARLLADNPGDTPVRASGVAYDVVGKEVGRLEWTVPAGAEEVLPLDDLDWALDPSSLGLSAEGCALSMEFELWGRPSIDVVVARVAPEEHVFAGVSDGLSGHVALIINPTDQEQIYRCQQRVRWPGDGGVTHTSWYRVPPGGIEHAVFMLDGDGTVQLTIDGGPAVVQPLRWSATKSILR